MWSVQPESIRISDTPEASSAPGTDNGTISTCPPAAPVCEKIGSNPKTRSGSAATSPTRRLPMTFSSFVTCAAPVLSLVQLVGRLFHERDRYLPDLQLRQNNPLLILVLSFTVRIANLAHLIGLKE